MKKIFILIILGIFFINLVIAQDFIFKQGEIAEIKLPVYNNNFSECVGCSCTLSIVYPNGSVMVENNLTSFSKGYANFTLFPYNTNIPGEYNGEMECNNGADYGFSTFNFKITPTGTELTTAQGLINIIFLISSFIIFTLCFFGAVHFPFGNNRDYDGAIISINDFKYVKVFLICITYVMLLFIVGLLRGITYSYLWDLGVYKFFNWIYWILFSFLWPLMICMFLFSLILFINDKKINKALRRGLPIR